LSRVLSAWRSFGRLPALAVVAVLYALLLLTGVTLGVSVAESVGVGLLSAFLLYCFARPRGGWEVYLLALLPGATAWLLNVLPSAPGWIGLLLVPVSLWMARTEDRREAVTRPHGSPPTSLPAPM
jgi:hypothetical protein